MTTSRRSRRQQLLEKRSSSKGETLVNVRVNAKTHYTTGNDVLPVYRAVLAVHEQTSSSDSMPDFILNPQAFPDIKLNDYVHISPISSTPTTPINLSASSSHKKGVYLQVKQLEEVKGSFQLSLRKSIADAFSMENRGEVRLAIVKPEMASIDFVELSFRDQYISRGDMWMLKEDLLHSTVFSTENLQVLGMDVEVNEILVNNTMVASGIITEHTKLVFRSRSARLIWMLQISEELWDCADDGELYFEKIINGLIKFIFDQWKSSSVNHSITIVLFTRTVFSVPDSDSATPWSSTPAPSGGDTDTTTTNVFQSDHHNRLFQDFYEVVLDAEPVSNLAKDWKNVRRILKRDIHKFSKNVQWNRHDKSTGLMGNPSTATNGNMLEAINLALNSLDKHYIDRDLHRTGLGIVVFTAGNGVLFVDEDLANLTSERMVDNGVGFDIISVAKRPIHAVPLFIYKQKPHPDNVMHFATPSKVEVPREWLVMKFFDYQDYLGTPMSSHLWYMKNSEDSFDPIPLCRMFPDEDAMKVKVTDNDSVNGTTKGDDIIIPFMEGHVLGANDIVRPGFLKSYDSNVFRENKTIKSESSFSIPEVFKKVAEESDASSPLSVSPLDFRSEMGGKSGHLISIASKDSGGSLTELSQSFSPTRSHTPVDAVRWANYQKRRSKLEKRMNPFDSMKHSLESDTKEGDFGDFSDEESLEMSIPLLDIGDSSKRKSKTTKSTPQKSTKQSSGPISRRLQRTFNVLNETSTNVMVESTVIMVEPSSSSSGDISNADDSVNPFKLHLKPLDPASDRRRWTHLLPATVDVFNYDSEQLNIKSLTIPAILPLTCDYFPVLGDRNNRFVNYVHTISLTLKNHLYGDVVETLLKELVAQRLTQDYQLVESSQVSESSGGSAASPTRSQIRYRLSMADECHQIDYDSHSGNIEVQRYIRRGRTKRSVHYSVSFPYRYFIWSKHLGRFYSQDINISSHHHDYNWNYVDQLISQNFQEFLISGIKYRSNHFVLIPGDIKNQPDFEERELSSLKHFLQNVLGVPFDSLGIDVSSLNNSEDVDLVRGLYSGSMEFPDSVSLKTESSSVRVELTSLRTDRFEWLDVVYDSTFHPGICFHFGVRWMVASGHLISEFVQKLHIQATALNLNLVQVPQQISYRNCYPFHAMLHISLNTPKLVKIAEGKLLSCFNFFLARRKSEEKREYIHVLGLASLRVLDDGFMWVNNNLSSAKPHRAASIQLYRQLLHYCHSLNHIGGYLERVVDSAMDSVVSSTDE